MVCRTIITDDDGPLRDRSRHAELRQVNGDVVGAGLGCVGRSLYDDLHRGSGRCGGQGDPGLRFAIPVAIPTGGIHATVTVVAYRLMATGSPAESDEVT